MDLSQIIRSLLWKVSLGRTRIYFMKHMVLNEIGDTSLFGHHQGISFIRKTETSASTSMLRKIPSQPVKFLFLNINSFPKSLKIPCRKSFKSACNKTAMIFVYSRKYYISIIYNRCKNVTVK